VISGFVVALGGWMAWDMLIIVGSLPLIHSVRRSMKTHLPCLKTQVIKFVKIRPRARYGKRLEYYCIKVD